MVEIVIGSVVLAAFFIAGFAAGYRAYKTNFQNYHENLRDSINREIMYSKAMRESNNTIMRLTSELERIEKDRYFG